jgi:predicted ArsR family transcriptional regulator
VDDAAPDDLTVLWVLAEPSRRALYEYVVAQRSWVSREQAADAVGIQRGIAAHHLDRLADEGLLEIDFERRTGRRGPGAGRPAKVYRRAPAELDVTLPARRYELAGQVLAAAADETRSRGVAIDAAIDAAARDAGREIGERVASALGRRTGTGARRDALLRELDTFGFEPQTAPDGVVVLNNCPFHRLAGAHTELICGMNVCVLDAVLETVGGTGLRASLEPQEGACCVRLRPEGRS